MSLDDADRELFAHIVEEFRDHGANAVDFLLTASDFVANGDPARQPRLAEAVSYCVREALKRILDSVERLGAGRWQTASRKVTDRKKKFEQVRGLPGADEQGALAELLRAVDELDDLHNEEGIHERRIIAVLVNRSGVAPVRTGRNLVVEYQGLIEDLNNAVHTGVDLHAASQGLDHALRLLRQLFLPPDTRMALLDELAVIEDPTTSDARRLLRSISTPNHVDYFFSQARSPRWLDLFMDSDLVTPPEGQAYWPVFRMIEKLATDSPNEITAWLDKAYDRWGGNPTQARYIVRAAADLGIIGQRLLVRGLKDYQQDASICQTVAWAIQGIEPSSPVVVQVADYLLNKSSGLVRIAGLDVHEGVVAKLVQGITFENGIERSQLLIYKLRSVADDDGERRLLLAGRAGFLSDIPDIYGVDRFSVLLSAFMKAIEQALEQGVPWNLLLDLCDLLHEELRSRVRAWVLGVSPVGDCTPLIDEVASSIGQRRPFGDDLRLIDRVVAEAPPESYVEIWSAALGSEPTSEEVAIATSAHSVNDAWLRVRDWSGILPPACSTRWRTVIALLGPVYGDVGRERFATLPRVEASWGRSPMTIEEISERSPMDAASAIAAWRPDPSQWLVGARELARALEEAVKLSPGPWLESPLQVIGTLSQPVYISHYFWAVSHAETDLADVADSLVESVAFCRRHPWAPMVLGRDDYDYDPDWRGVDQAGIAVLTKLADSDAGFGGRLDQAWNLIADAARDRSEESSLLSPREDPLETAINRPCTRALQAAISFMAFEYRTAESVQPEALDLLDEALRIPGWDGAEHRAIIAPRLGFLLYVAPTWVDERVNLLLGQEAPGELGQVTVDITVKWGRPTRWFFEHARAGILDSVSRRVDNALTLLLVGMLWDMPEYDSAKLVKLIGGTDSQLLSKSGEALGRLLRGDEVDVAQVNIGASFWRETLNRDVVGIAVQPFVLHFRDDEGRAEHTPDVFARLADGTGTGTGTGTGKVIDIRPRVFAGSDDFLRKCAATRAACRVAGWDSRSSTALTRCLRRTWIGWPAVATSSSIPWVWPRRSSLHACGLSRSGRSLRR